MSTINLINASCVEQEVDAVVNASNRYLMSGGGICGAIFKKAGYIELNEACRKYKTPLNDGDAVITPAFKITNTKYIIHAVGPDFGHTPDAYDKLFDAYYNSLKVLKENNLHTISFPLISSGIFGGNLDNPVKTSTEHCLKAYNEFILDYPEYSVDVFLCAYSTQEMAEAEVVFEKNTNNGDINLEDIRRGFFIDIRDREKREKFVNEILEFEGMSLKSNNSSSFDLAKEKVIKSVFPISIDLESLEMDYIKNTTCAAASITNKFKFVTPDEALEKVKNELEKWKKYKEDVIISLIQSDYNYNEETARKLVKDCELEIFEQFYLKGDTPLGCAIEIGYSCG